MAKFSQSKLKTYRRCPKQYEYKYIEQLRSVRQVPKPSFGTLFHTLVAAWHIAQGVKEGSLKSKPEIGIRGVTDTVDMTLTIPAVSHEDILDLVLPAYRSVFFDNLWPDIAEEFNAEYGGDFVGHCGNVFKAFVENAPPMLHPQKPVYVEHTIENDTFEGIVDLVYESSTGFVQRDYKTSNGYLSVSYDEVATNIQHVLYSTMLPQDIVRSEYLYISTKLPNQEPRRNKNGELSAASRQPWFASSIEVESELQCRVDDEKFWFLQEVPITEQLQANLLNDAYSTIGDIARGSTARTLTYSCMFDCPYKELCTQELFGYDTTLLRKEKYGTKNRNNS